MMSEKTIAWFYAALVLLIAAAVLAAVVCGCGCAGKTVSGLAPAATADGRSSATAAGGGHAVSTQETNDPVVAWILAGGAAIVTPVCFLLYMLSKRTWVHRWLTGARTCGTTPCRPPSAGSRAAEIARQALSTTSSAGENRPP